MDVSEYITHCFKITSENNERHAWYECLRVPPGLVSLLTEVQGFICSRLQFRSLERLESAAKFKLKFSADSGL